MKDDGPKPLSTLLGGARFVWEAKARAEKAQARGSQEKPAEATLAPYSKEAEAMVLALMAKFCPEAEKTDVCITPEKRQRPESAPNALPKTTNTYSAADDAIMADPTWLHMNLGGIPPLVRSVFRPGPERYSRWCWRVALAAVMQRAPDQIEKIGGMLVAQVRKAASSRYDVRTSDTYCAQPGWGIVAYRFAGVLGLIHLREGCRCQ